MLQVNAKQNVRLPQRPAFIRIMLILILILILILAKDI
jgi:hypothetical protein